MGIFGKILKNKNARAGGFYLIGNMFNKALVFLTVPIFTRIMSTSEYGIVDTYLSWISILSLIVGLSLGNSIRTAYVDFKEDLDNYISSIFFLSLINFIISSGLIIFVSYIFINELDILLVIACLFQSYMTFILNSMKIKYMMSQEYIKGTLLLAVPSVLIVGLSIVFILNIEEQKYWGRIIPYLIVTTIFASIVLFKVFLKGKRLINFNYWKYAITLSTPLIFHGLSVNILTTSDRTMITVFNGSSETGIYSLVFNLSLIIIVVATSLESVWIPWFTKKLQNNEKNIINQNVKIYIELILVTLIILLLTSPEILTLMAPKEFWGGIILVPTLLLSSFFMFLYSISVNLEYYHKSTKVIAINTFVAALINLVLNFIFIPIYGALGATFTTVFAYIISFVIHYNTARKLDKELFPLNVYILPIVIALLSVIITYAILDYPLVRWLITLIGFPLYFIFCLKNSRFSVLLK